MVVEEAPAPIAITGRAQRGEVASDGTNAPAAAAQDPQADERARRLARTQLPQTAGWTPTLMIGGVVALLAGLALAVRRLIAV